MNSPVTLGACGQQVTAHPSHRLLGSVSGRPQYHCASHLVYHIITHCASGTMQLSALNFQVSGVHNHRQSNRVSANARARLVIKRTGTPPSTPSFADGCVASAGQRPCIVHCSTARLCCLQATATGQLHVCHVFCALARLLWATKAEQQNFAANRLLSAAC